MNRREFIINTTAAAIALMSVDFVHTQSGREISRPIEKSIKAHFGAGFQLHSHKVEQEIIFAVVEHLENRYLITSIDSIEWTIISSSIS